MKKTVYERYARWMLLSAAVLAVPLLYGAEKAAQTNRNDVKDWLPATFDETRDFKWFQANFENETQVLVSWPGGTLDDPRVEQFARLVVGDENEPANSIDTSLFSSVLTGTRLFEKLTSPPTNLSRAEAIERLSGLLVGKDGAQTSAVVSLTPKGQLDPHRTVAELYRAAKAATGLPRAEIYMGGPPVDNVAIDQEGQNTLRYLATLCAVIGFSLAYWCLRQWRLTILVFATAVYSAMAALALVYFTGNSMDAILYSMPPVVYTAALSGSLHIINYYRGTVYDQGRENAATVAMRRAWVPCLISAGTTAIGLGSLCISQLVPIRSFGFYAAMGVMATLALLFTCVPSALQLWPPRLKPPPPIDPLADSHLAWHGRMGMRFAWGVVRHHAWVCLAFTLTLVGFGLGATRIKTSVSLADLFSDDAEVVTKYAWLEDQLGGLVPMEVVLRFDNRTNDMNFLERLELVDRVQRHLAALDEVDSTMSPATFTPQLPSGSIAVAPRRVGSTLQRMLVRNPDYVRRDVYNKQLEKSRGELEDGDYLKRYSDAEQDEELWRITTRLHGLTGIDYGAYVEQIRTHVEPLLDEAQEQGHEGISAVYTGVTPVVYKAERSLLEGLVESFFMAFLTMAAIMAIVYRSPLAGLLVMFPNVWPMAIVFGLLGYLGVKVDIGTMMTASVAMGVAVDDSAHLVAWFRLGVAKGYDNKNATVYAYRNAAITMAQSSIIVAMGLSVFGFSSFVPTKMFGLLMVALLAWGLFADLLLMPAILAGPLGRLFARSIKQATPAPMSSV